MPTDNLQNDEKPKKKQLFFLIAGKSCPLDFNSVLVYSFLIYRYRAAKGQQQAASVTRQQIQIGTGLCATRTIPKALEKLQEHGLIGYHGNRVFAFQPRDNQWFVPYRNPGLKPWYARITYFPIWVPASAKSSGLLPRVNALYFLIKNKPHQTQSYYALKMNVSATTVRSSIKQLRRLKLIASHELVAFEPSDEQLNLWQDRKKRTATTVTGWKLSKANVFVRVATKLDSLFLYCADEEKTPRQMFDWYADQFGIIMLSRGYSRTEIESYWNEVAQCFRIDGSRAALNKFELFAVKSFIEVFEHAENITLRSAAAGTFAGSNSLGLLKRLTQEAVREITIAWDNYSNNGLGTCRHQWKAKA